jgi:hypothetical protein
MIDFKYDPNEINKILPREFARQIKFTLSVGINNVLYGAREKQIGKKETNYTGGEMDEYLAGGSRVWTKKGMAVIQANKNSLKGKLIFESNREYMRPLIYGGTVTARKSKLVQPSKRLLESKKIGAVSINEQGGISPLRKAVAKNKIKKSYFLGELKGKRPKEGNSYGLWRRYKDGKTPRLQLVLSLARSSRQQESIYPADRLIDHYVDKNIQRHMEDAMAYAIKTAK